jgi:CheY-like chemotaxis protein
VGLVITDIKMPGVGSGVDAYRQLRKASPNLPVIFLTAIKLDEAQAMIPPDPKVRLLPKPINFEALHAAIKEFTGLDRLL